jgi:hypothetical protein
MSETPRGPQSGAGPAFVAPVVAEERQGISRRRRLAARLEPTPPGAAPIDVARAPRAPDQPPRVAIFVAHGMGQQVKFETLGTLATALRREAMRRGQNVPTVAVRMLRFDDDTIPRAELTLPDAQGREREVHLFEGYWAPLTEGEISLPQTLQFLWGAGVAGFMRSLSGWFPRFLFGRRQWLPVGARSGWAFVTALAVFGGLVALNGIIASAAISRLLSPMQPRWPEPRLFVDLSADMLVFLAAIAAAGGGVALARMRRRNRTDGTLRVPGRGVILTGWALVWLAVALTVLCGALAIAHVMIHRCPGREHALWCGWGPFARLATVLTGPCPPWLPALGAAALWVGVLGVTARIGSVLTQFVGDVAIYVSSHTVNRFHKTRNEMQAEVNKVARCAYEWSESEDGAPYYDRVIVVGHSLGSVIGYDALNAMLREDDLDGGAGRVAERTSMLLTFGSPLDKTAFLFRNQLDDTSDVREALAAAVQPLIRDYALRPKRWVNLWSPGDWIGASLTYYDDTGGDGGEKRIENLRDDDATTPLLAHNEHWEGRLLGRTLFDEAVR